MKYKKIAQGYIPDPPSEKDYVFGAGNAPIDEVLPTGNWREVDLLPERQSKQFDTFGCTNFTTLNALECLLKIKFKEWHNKSERFNYIDSGTAPGRGNTPKNAADSIRKKGTIPESELPFDDSIDTIEKFSSPNPLPIELYRKAEEFLKEYEFKYDFLPTENGQVSRETLRKALKCSPIGIAVYAWAEKDGVYVRAGGDVHFTLLVNVKESGELEVFDSYEPFYKTLSADFPIYIAQRYYLRKKTEEEKKMEAERISLFQKVLSLILLQLQRIAEQVNALVKKKEEPKEKEEPKKKLLIAWATAIRKYEDMDPYFNNPGALKAKDGKFIVFKTYEDGWSALLDYLVRAATGKHKAYPKAGETTLLEFTRIYAPSWDSNNPDRYATWISKQIGVPVDTPIKELIKNQ